jgi:hypothetical protein
MAGKPKTEPDQTVHPIRPLVNISNVNGQYILDYWVYNNWNSGTEEANGEMVSVNVGYRGDYMQAGCPCITASWMQM